MCLIAFAWQAHDAYPLIVAGNRDEFFARATASADWWTGDALLAGKDLRGGGTWMGVTRDGRFAALTNYRDPRAMRSDAPSRGELVQRFLAADDPDRALAGIARDRARYNGFNLIAARWDDDRPTMSIVSQPGPADVVPVAPGVHGLSNAHLDTSWPKVDAIVDGLDDGLRRSSGPDALIELLFALLADRSVAADDRLPETGVSHEFERALSAAFIRMPGYGTRSSTVLLVDRSGHVTFIERRCEPDEPIGERRFEFDRVSAVRAS